MSEYTNKVNEFFECCTDISNALNVLYGGGISCKTLSDIATKIEEFQPVKNMGSRTVTFTQNTITYGFQVTEAESDPTARVTYLDDAQGMVPISLDLTTGNCTYYTWRNSWIFRKIYPVMLKTDGTIDYRLNTENQTLKATGESAEISTQYYDGNAMICIEKFYTKFTFNGVNEEIRISNNKQEGFEAIGFIREDGSEADRIFMPMFSGFNDSNGKLRSISGYKITFETSYDEFVSAAEKNGTGYGIYSYAMNEAFSAVITTLIKSCDYKKKLGEGRGCTNAKTGILVDKGPFAYDPTTKTVKALWIEDYVTSRISTERIQFYESGLLSSSTTHYYKMKPPYSGTSTDGYTRNMYSAHTGIINEMYCSNQYGRYPYSVNGTEDNYETCYWSTTPNYNLVYASLRGAECGIWGRDVGATADTKSVYMTSALSYLPPA